MKHFFLIVTLCLSAIGAETAPSSEGAEFQIDKNLMNELYQGSLNSASVDTHPISSGILISSQFSLFNPQGMVLSNDYFEVPYTGQVGAIPAVRFGASGLLTYWSGLEVYLMGEIGYTFKEGTYKVRSNKAQTNQDRTGAVRFHWLPVALGSKLQYQFGSFRAVKPFIKAMAGAQWLYQTGTLDGLEQGFWVPFYEWGAGLTLFENTEGQGAWFGGVTAGVSQKESFGSSQLVRGWSVDIGVNILL